jgi:bifunctional non-homologous end joining protein LigD
MGRLGPYRARRRFRETAEPVGEEPVQPSAELRFVVQEHAARRLHWDLRLERDGVLVSWALPRGVPEDPRRNHLAVHVEDHPLEYRDFEGDIPSGNYGAGTVRIWDRGTYETHTWRMEGRKPEVVVTFHGGRLQGRYALFQTRGKNWMIHRMDPPLDPEWEEMPTTLRPMLAEAAKDLPSGRAWAFEFKWDGVRAIVFSQEGSVRVLSRSQEEVTGRYPELRAIARALGSHAAVLDGEIVALGADGVPRFEQLQRRIGLNREADVRRGMQEVPVAYLAFDLLYLDGRGLMDRPYLERRRLLLELGLSGPHWQVPEHTVDDGEAVLAASRARGLEGVMAKRTDSPYEEGRRSRWWLKIKNRPGQELVIAGWVPGQGRREGLPGALLVGYWDGSDFVYAGRVGTGFTETELERLARLMAPLERRASPFGRGRPPAGARFLEPKLVGDFEFAEWTRAGQVRSAAYKGLRDDRDAREVVREVPG